MKKFKFKDGQVIIAATKEEAIKKHKVTASEYTDLGLYAAHFAH